MASGLLFRETNGHVTVSRLGGWRHGGGGETVCLSAKHEAGDASVFPPRRCDAAMAAHDGKFAWRAHVTNQGPPVAPSHYEYSTAGD